MTVLLEASNLCYRDVIEDVSFSLHRGELVTLVGPNGAGKTTLLRLLLGLLTPTSGTCIRPHQSPIGYMPQRLSLDQSLPLSVQQFLHLTRHRGGGVDLTHGLARTRAAHLTHKSMHDLSGGEWQRVLLARAMMGSPPLLLLDEPMQGVDVQGQEDFYALIQSLKTDGEAGILLVSHDLHFVHTASDRVMCLQKHICCAGTPADVREDQTYQKLLGIVPAFNTHRPYAHHHDHSHHDHIPNESPPQ